MDGGRPAGHAPHAGGRGGRDRDGAAKEAAAGDQAAPEGVQGGATTAGAATGVGTSGSAGHCHARAAEGMQCPRQLGMKGLNN